MTNEPSTTSRRFALKMIAPLAAPVTAVAGLGLAAPAVGQDVFRPIEQRQGPGEDGYVWIGPKSGAWWATLETPGGPLGFRMNFTHLGANEFDVSIQNGNERIPVEFSADSESQTFTMDFPHYNASIAGIMGGSGVDLQGDYFRQVGPDTERFLPFSASLSRAGAYRVDTIDEAVTDPFAALRLATENPLAERWEIRFEDDEDPAVGVFETLPDGVNVRGTILTTTGDYRYLSGVWDGNRLRLATFDGAHAFLFDATAQGDGLSGDFWSGEHYHTTFNATPNPDAKIGNGFGRTSYEQPDWSALSFPDLDGEERSLDGFIGKPLVIEIMGSWCPNCHDAASEMKRLQTVFGDRVQTMMIAFEAMGDFEQDAEQVRRYLDRHGLSDLDIPVLIGGLKDKDEATRALGFLDELRAFPTTIFVNADGSIEAVHTGFAGPATGIEHEKQVIAFSETVGRMVDAAE